MAQISAVVNTYEDTSSGWIAEAQRKVKARAIVAAVTNGADPVYITIFESEAIPIEYTTGRCRFYLKAVGE